jgi:hypothetical protein
MCDGYDTVMIKILIRNFMQKQKYSGSVNHIDKAHCNMIKAITNKQMQYLYIKLGES